MKTTYWRSSSERSSSELWAAVALLLITLPILLIALPISADGSVGTVVEDPSYQTELPWDGSSSSGGRCGLGAAGCSGSGSEGWGSSGSGGGLDGSADRSAAEEPSSRPPVDDRAAESRASRPAPSLGASQMAPAAARLLQTVLLVLGLAFLIYLLVTWLQGQPMAGRAEQVPEVALDPKSFDGQTLGPLSEVDALAAAGRYGEAVHLLWLNAVPVLGRRWNRVIETSWTSREVLRRSGAPAEDRRTLEPVVRAVELFFFGGRSLDRSDYESCRRHLDAYLQRGTP